MVTCLQTISAVNKKVRLANLMADEFLAELALKYQAVISCVENSNDNELSSSIIVEFYLTVRCQPVKFVSAWSVNCRRNAINQMLVESASYVNFNCRLKFGETGPKSLLQSFIV